MKIILKYLAFIIGGLSTTYLLFMYFISSYMGSSSIETWDAMQQQTFNCPTGTEVTYRGWSENGRMRYCEASKMGLGKHGCQVINGYKALIKMGKKKVYGCGFIKMVLLAKK